MKQRLTLVGPGEPPAPSHPPYPYIAFESATVNTVWLVGDSMTPTRLANASASQIEDVSINPTNASELVYATFASGTDWIIQVIDCETGTESNVITVSGEGGTTPQPDWHPDGIRIVYVASTGTPAGNDLVLEIRSVERDGTNDTLLYTVTPTAGTFNNGLFGPAVSSSGNYIAFGRGMPIGTNEQMWVMEDDGSNPTQVATSATDLQGQYLRPSWQNASDVIGWVEKQNSNSVWRKCNADGTGLTTLLTDANWGTGIPPAWKWIHNAKKAWLLDDSAMVSYKQVDDDTEPRSRLAIVDGSGGGDSFIGSHFGYWVTANINAPVVYGDGRIYFTLGDPGGALIDQQVSSVLADGSDLVTEDDGTGIPTHGYHTIDRKAD